MTKRPGQRKSAQDREAAVALRYNKETDNAPRLVAKGRGLIAEKIREIAKVNNIPIHQDDDLVEILAQIDIDREVPPELYGAIAEILSWIYRANAVMKKELVK
jgi:flagellar biosynthesis protein